MHAKVIIIGSGPAGYTAAIYASRAMLEPIMIAGIKPGGQLTDTTDVENYPGFAEVIQGPWLMDQMRMQAEHFGTRMENDYISSMDLSRRPFKLFGDSGTVYTCDTLIVATGAEARWLNLPSEPKFRGFGLSACATCDGFFFKNREVVVVGGGNTAIEDATFLTRFANKVTIVHRRHEFRAEKILQARLFTNPKINVIWNSVVEDIIGLDGPPPKVTGLAIRNVHAGERTELRADGVFVAIGHAPASALVGDQLRRKPSGYIWTAPDSTATNVPGVFAAGDVTDETFRQAVTAAGQGCMAALEAERFLAAEEHQPAVAAE